MPIEVGGDGFIPGFTDQLEGIKAGEERVLNVAFPEEYGAKELAGKAAEFTVTCKSLKQPIIIVITGRTDIELAKKALDLGAAEYITKPFELPHLKEKVKSCMKPAPEKEKKSEGLPWRIAGGGPPSE